jgi:hypothetical protein
VLGALTRREFRGLGETAEPPAEPDRQDGRVRTARTRP